MIKFDIKLNRIASLAKHDYPPRKRKEKGWKWELSAQQAQVRHGIPSKLPVSEVPPASIRHKGIKKMTDGQLNAYLSGVEAELEDGVKPGESREIILAIVNEAKRRVKA